MKVIPRQREFYEKSYPDDFYSEEIFNTELDDDEISSYEQGFMRGYIKA